jgi:hypothetical protein
MLPPRPAVFCSGPFGHCLARGLTLVLLALAAVMPLGAQTLVDESLRLEGQASLRRASAWLLSEQAENGGWSDHPGITAMTVLALARSPEAATPKFKAALAKAQVFIRQHARADGAIVTAAAVGNEVYSTAAATMALAVLGDPADREVVRRARAWMLDEREQRGLGFRGLGYSQQGYPDLSNTHWVLEALYLSGPFMAEQMTEAEKTRVGRFWRSALGLVNDCQLPAPEAEAGGFAYYPLTKKVTDMPVPPGASAHAELPVHQAWGSLTWGALKAYAYAKVGEAEPRVKAARGWVSRRGSWKEHPGLGAGGYYYYCYELSSAAVAWGWDKWPDAKGKEQQWRLALLPALLSRQGGEGAWANPNPLWLEQDPRLCTAYAMLTMELCLLPQ